MEDIIIYKVYRIFGSGLNYYGSTHQPLYERKATHKQSFKNNRQCCSSKEILEKGPWEIEIVELLPNGSSLTDALNREKFWIQNNECVNKCVPILSKEEKTEYQRLWAEDKRRSNGVKIKCKMPEEEQRIRKNLSEKKSRDKRTPEEKEEHLKHRRETRKPLTEEQKLNAKLRAQKQRDDKKNT